MKSVKFTNFELSLFLQVKSIVRNSSVKYIKVTKHKILYKDSNGRIKYIEIENKSHKRNRSGDDHENEDAKKLRLEIHNPDLENENEYMELNLSDTDDMEIDERQNNECEGENDCAEEENVNIDTHDNDNNECEERNDNETHVVEDKDFVENDNNESEDENDCAEEENVNINTHVVEVEERNENETHVVEEQEHVVDNDNNECEGENNCAEEDVQKEFSEKHKERGVPKSFKTYFEQIEKYRSDGNVTVTDSIWRDMDMTTAEVPQVNLDMTTAEVPQVNYFEDMNMNFFGDTNMTAITTEDAITNFFGDMNFFGDTNMTAEGSQMTYASEYYDYSNFNYPEVYSQGNQTNNGAVVTVNKCYDDLKNDVLSLEDIAYRNIDNLVLEDLAYREINNLVLEEEKDFYNIIKNCLNTEVYNEIGTCKLLMNYYRVGAYLNEIWKIVDDDVDLSQRPWKSRVTGIIKGSGIAKAHVAIFGKYGTNESKRARLFYKKSIRTFKIYKCFQSALTQICRSKIMSVNKITEMKHNVFEEFVTDIEMAVAANSDKYRSECGVEIINSKLITKEVIAEVKKFINDPYNINFEN